MKREHRPVKNVVGYVEGADPSLRGDRVIVGAHFDHEGVDSTGQIYNGADDNASGTAGVLELAEAFLELKAQGHRPRRTVVFALWNGEERGLLGSTYYVRHPMPENGRTFAYLNLDMIGRSEEVPDPSSISGFHGLERTTAAENANRIHLIGYSFHPWLAGRVAAANQQIGLTLEQKRDPPELGFVRTSDHWSFLARDIPAVFLYTGEHPQVHQPEDDLERIDFAKMEKIVRLAFLTLWSLANEP
jgi:Zn-dependent M28 family amino/carboxypeptidase